MPAMRRVAQLISVRSRCRGQQKKETHTAHWDRIHGVTEKQHEALDRGDLDKEKGEADRKEIQSDSPSRESSGRGLRPLTAEPQEGCQDQDQSQHRRLHQRCHQHGVAPIKQRRTAEGAPLQELGQRLPFEEIEKVGSVVGGRRDIKLVVPKEFFALWSKQRDGAIEEIILIENIESVCLLTRHSTEKAEVKGALLGEASDCCRVFAGHGTVLNQKRGGVPASHERQVATRLADPSVLQR